MASSIDTNLFVQHSNILPFLSSLTNRITTQAPGSKKYIFPALPVLLNCDVASKKKKKQKRQLNESQNNGTTWSPSYFLLSQQDLKQNEYPLPDNLPTSEMDGWITFAKVNDTAVPNMLAVDCEMVGYSITALTFIQCITSIGLELTRVSIVNENLEIVYDTYVKPPNEIVDYNTRYVHYHAP